MKKIIITLIIVTLLPALYSFVYHKNTTYAGIYGVHDSDPSAIKLTLRENQTFSFQDFSVDQKPVDVSGTWIIKGNKVLLEKPKSASDFHTVWTFESDGQVAKSRKGLTFYRLRKMSL